VSLSGFTARESVAKLLSAARDGNVQVFKGVSTWVEVTFSFFTPFGASIGQILSLGLLCLRNSFLAKWNRFNVCHCRSKPVCLG